MMTTQKPFVRACLGCAGTAFDEVMNLEGTRHALFSCVECFAVYRWPVITKAPPPVTKPLPPNFGTYGRPS
jgi:hypothetical protein